MAKTLHLPCTFAAFVAKTLPLPCELCFHCLPLAKTVPFLVVVPAAQGLGLEFGSATGAQLEVLAVAYPGLTWRPSEYCAG